MDDEQQVYKRIKLDVNSELVKKTETVGYSIYMQVCSAGCLIWFWSMASFFYVGIMSIFGFLLIAILMACLIFFPSITTSVLEFTSPFSEIIFHILAAIIWMPIAFFGICLIALLGKDIKQDLLRSIGYSDFVNALDRWNDECVPMLNRLPGHSEVADEELAKDVRRVNHSANALHRTICLQAAELYADYERLDDTERRKRLRKLNRACKKFAKALKSLELRVETDMLSREPIAAAMNGKYRTMSERQRAKQRAKIERDKHLESWDKR